MSEDTNEGSSSDSSNQTVNTDTSPTTVPHNWRQPNHPGVTIVKAVASATNREMSDLPPLQETLETDALETLLNSQSPSIVVSFRYAGTSVSVSGDGSIEVRVDGHRREEDDG